MAYVARVYRVLIASPSDVVEEREIAVRVVQEWNDLNSPERQLVLLPLRWETHSAPEYGKRPQEVINRQVVDRCDLLIGIFWTRIGSPTGAAESGTLEEIDRVAKEGKPVMLYFSEVKQNPADIDLEQLAKLREFRKRTYPKALVENYSNLIGFRDKLAKQIEIQLRSLVAEDSEGSRAPDASGPVTDIQLQFADPKAGNPIGESTSAKSFVISVSDFPSVPDYKAPATASQSALLPFSPTANANYYREKLTYLIQRTFFRPVRFWLKNNGQIGARDVYVDLTIASAEGDIILLPKTALPSSPPSKTADYFASSLLHINSPEEFLSKAKNSWSTQFEVSALQPKREIAPEPSFFIGASRSLTVDFTAKIYADTLPEPLVQKLKIDLNITTVEATAGELLDDLPTSEAAGDNGTDGKSDEQLAAEVATELRAKRTRSSKT